MSENNKWQQPISPPPPLFLGKKERDLTKQINDELIERVIGQTLLYYPLSMEHTNYHKLYGEAIEKSYTNPVIIKALIEWQPEETVTSNYGIDKDSKIVIKFHRRRLTQDQDLYVREGDVIFYGLRFYEIVKLSEPRLLFGQVDQKFEIQATCTRARGGFFEEPIEISEIRQSIISGDGGGAGPPLPTPDDTVGSCGGLIRTVSGLEGSSTYSQFYSYATSPQNYPGCIIYLTQVGATIYEPFYRANKFYFNENGTWFGSPFLLEL